MRKKRLLGVATALVMSFSCLSYIPDDKSLSMTLIGAYASDGRLYNQYEEKWQEVIFDRYALTQNSMYISGCGIFSFCNAIYGLNDNIADAVEVASWAVENGSYQPGNGGMYYISFYNTVGAGFGEKLNFRIDGQYYGKVTDERLVNHLKNGGVAAIHVYGHLMAITGYNEDDNTYHVVESAVHSMRGLEPEGWVSAEKMSSGYTNVDWYALISNTKPPVPVTPELNVNKPVISFSDEAEISWEAVSDAESYNITLYRNGELYSEETTGNCNFKKQLPEGDYTVNVSAENISGVSPAGTVEFKVNPPVPVAPEPKLNKSFVTADSEAEISWEAVEKAEHYNIMLYRNGELYSEETAENYNFKKQLPEGDYTVNVSAENISGVSPAGVIEFKVNPPVPDSPELKLNKPVVSANDDVEISWEAVEKAEHYNIMLYRNGELYSEETTENCNFKKQLPEGSYKINVSAENISGASTAGTAEFDVYASAPDSPELSVEKTLFPVGKEVVIAWNSVKSAEYYSVSIYRDNRLYSNAKSYGITKYSESLPEGNYTVCVSAGNSFGRSEDSRFAFTVGDYVRGDINSDYSVNISDIVLLEKHLLSSGRLTAEQFKSADINNDGTVDIFDMVMLRQIVIKG